MRALGLCDFARSWLNFARFCQPILVYSHCCRSSPHATACLATSKLLQPGAQHVAAEMLPLGHKRKRVQTKLFGDDFVRDDLRPGKGARRRKVMEPGGPDEAQGADALLSLAALAEEAETDTQSPEEGTAESCPNCIGSTQFVCLWYAFCLQYCGHTMIDGCNSRCSRHTSCLTRCP